MNKKWIDKKPDSKKVSSLMNQTNASKYLCSALVNRDIDNLQSTIKFLKPNIKDLYNPNLMKDIPRAVTRIRKAIREGETICIYGDYD